MSVTMLNACYVCCTPDCRSFGKEFDVEEAQSFKFVCLKCGQPLNLFSEAASSDIHPSSLPSYFAHPWSSYLQETNSRVKLHWLVDTAEVCVRFCVAIALAELVAGNSKPAGDLAETIRAIILRPTLGAWLVILRLLSVEGKKLSDCAIAPNIFNLYDGEISKLFNEQGTASDSLLVLRNTLVHSGGISTRAAGELLASHRESIESLLTVVMKALPDVQIISLTKGCATLLQGTTPTRIDFTPPALVDKPDGPWLVKGGNALSLFPLLEFAPIEQIGDEGQLVRHDQNETPQVYHRANLEKERLSYAPLGSDALSADRFDLSNFYELFGFEVQGRKKKPRGSTHSDKTDSYEWDDFLQEAKPVTPQVPQGRKAAIDRVRVWLKGRDTRQEGIAAIGWIHGEPGIGKSLLMARLALDAANDPKKQQTYYHCFRGGDARNNRQSFLSLLRECLLDWQPLAQITPEATRLEDDKGLLKDVTTRLEAIKNLPDLNANNPKAKEPVYPRLLVFLDGLDELAIYDRTFPHLVKQLALPGTVWVVAGRDEHGLGHMFSGLSCETLFEGDGLSRLADGDIHAILRGNSLPAIQRALVELDKDQADRVSNDFIDRVVKYAQGLPLYVHLVMEDLESGRLKVDQWNDLPTGIENYYNRLLDRMGIGTIQVDLCNIVCLLASAEEPLDEESLARLLATDEFILERMRERVARALRAGATLIKGSETPEYTVGFVLYHQSFREHITGKRGFDGKEETSPAEKTIDILLEARSKLRIKSKQWSTLPEGNLKNHLFRWGNVYALLWGEAVGVKEAHERLTDFDYLMERTRVLPSSNISELVKEYAKVYHLLSEGEQKHTFRYWEAFFRERAHILRRGNEEWPTYKILLQLAVEHADDSPITIAAEKFLEEGKCNWVWMRNEKRQKTVTFNPCIAVFEGHAESVKGVVVSSDGRIMSWDNNYIILWDGFGVKQLSIKMHSDEVYGAKFHPNDKLISWSDDKTIKVWGTSGELLNILSGHHGPVKDTIILNNGNILSWSIYYDDPMILWDIEGNKINTLVETPNVTDISILTRNERLYLIGKQGFVHTAAVLGAKQLPDGKLLSWSRFGKMFLWSQDGCLLKVLDGHSDDVNGVAVLDDNRILSWSNDATIRVWSASGETEYVLEGHTKSVQSVFILKDERLLSWGSDNTVRIWSSTGEPIENYSYIGVKGVNQLSSGEVAFWGENNGQYYYRTIGGDTNIFEYYKSNNRISGVQILPDGRLMAVSGEYSIIVWDCCGKKINELTGHSSNVCGALTLPGDRIVSWSDDTTIRVWDSNIVQRKNIVGHSRKFDNLLLNNGNILTWTWGSEDTSLRIWDNNAELKKILKGHQKWINNVSLMPDGRILSWSVDGTGRIWNSDGDLLQIMSGHIGVVNGTYILNDGRILSWSDDRTLQLWSRLGEHLKTIDGHNSSVLAAFQLKCGHILSWSQNRLLLWDKNCELINSLEGHESSIDGAHYSAKINRILTWTRGQTLRIWDQDSLCLKVIDGISVGTSRPFNIIKNKILVKLLNGSMQILDKNGRKLYQLVGHTKEVIGVLTLIDGKLLTWSKDKTIILWSNTGNILQVYSGIKGTINNAALVNGNKIIAWADNEAIVWSINGNILNKNDIDPSLVIELYPKKWQVENMLMMPSYKSIKLFSVADLTNDAEKPINWESEYKCELIEFRFDGSAIVSQYSGNICLLQSYFSNHPIAVRKIASTYLNY